MRTVTRIVTAGGPIPVTVGTVDTRRKHEESKMTTVKRMAALRRQKRRQLRGSRPRRPPPSDCWHFWEVGAGRGGPYHGRSGGGWLGCRMLAVKIRTPQSMWGILLQVPAYSPARLRSFLSKLSGAHASNFTFRLDACAPDSLKRALKAGVELHLVPFPVLLC